MSRLWRGIQARDCGGDARAAPWMRCGNCAGVHGAAGICARPHHGSGTRARPRRLGEGVQLHHRAQDVGGDARARACDGHAQAKAQGRGAAHVPLCVQLAVQGALALAPRGSVPAVREGGATSGLRGPTRCCLAHSVLAMCSLHDAVVPCTLLLVCAWLLWPAGISGYRSCECVNCVRRELVCCANKPD